LVKFKAREINLGQSYITLIDAVISSEPEKNDVYDAQALWDGGVNDMNDGKADGEAND